MLCFHLQTFEAALFLEEVEESVVNVEEVEESAVNVAKLNFSANVCRLQQSVETPNL